MHKLQLILVSVLVICVALVTSGECELSQSENSCVIGLFVSLITDEILMARRGPPMDDALMNTRSGVMSAVNVPDNGGSSGNATVEELTEKLKMFFGMMNDNFRQIFN